MQDFNPLRREGGDGKGGIDRVVVNQFQSTPPRGRRRHSGFPTQYSADFNPLRREGGDQEPQGLYCRPADFNPLRREGGDSYLFQIRYRFRDFNPLRREGGDDFLS